MPPSAPEYTAEVTKTRRSLGLPPPPCPTLELAIATLAPGPAPPAAAPDEADAPGPLSSSPLHASNTTKTTHHRCITRRRYLTCSYRTRGLSGMTRLVSPPSVDPLAFSQM